MSSKMVLESVAILRLNIERYQRLLVTEREPAKRQQITSLLHDALLNEAEAVGTRLSAQERRIADDSTAAEDGRQRLQLNETPGASIGRRHQEIATNVTASRPAGIPRFSLMRAGRIRVFRGGDV